MRNEKAQSILMGAVLAFAVSFGAAGCLVTGFDLNLTDMVGLALICAAASVLCAACWQWKYGGGAVLCVMALLAGYLWRQGTALTQLLALITRLSVVYDRAYGCGVLYLTEEAWDAGLADYPMAILGALIAMSVSRAACRGKGTWMAVTGTVMPMALCFVVTDTVPNAGFLFTVMAGLLLLIFTSSVRRDSIAQANRLAAMAVIPVVLALAVLFLAIPREGYSFYPQEMQNRILSWAEGASQLVEDTVENFSGGVQAEKRESVDLKSLGARVENTIPVMEVTAGETGMLYLRGQDYDGYDGSGWSSSDDRTETFTRPGETAGDVTIRTRHRKNILYLPYYPTETTQLTGGMVENEGGLEYTLARSCLPENWRDLVYSSGNTGYGSDLARYVDLPQYTKNGAAELLATFLPQSGSNTEKADAIAAYVCNSAEYDLNPQRMDAGEADFALWFLVDSDKGYCVHFATAAAVLLRAADIPARYVTGYAVKAKAGQAVTVTGENAHAWAEYYEPSLDAWIVLEATPADFHAAVEETAEPSWQETYETTEAPTEAEMTWETTRSEETVPKEETIPLPTAGTGEPAENKADLHWLGSLAKWVLSILAGAVLLVAQRGLRCGLRRTACRTGAPNARALARWREAERLAKLLKEPPPEELEALARKAKFSQHTLTAEELAKFDAYHRAAIRRLRQKPWYLRLVYAYVFAAY